MDFLSFIWVNALNNAQPRQFSTDIHAFNVLSHKFGMVLIALVDVLPEKFGLMEIVFVQIITNGTDIIVFLAQEEKYGIQALESAVVHHLRYGTDSIVFLAMVVVYLTQHQKHVYALLVHHGTDIRA